MSLELGDLFKVIGGAAGILGKVLPDGAGVASRIIEATMTTAAALLELGLDPEVEIPRMHCAKPDVARARAVIAAAIAAKFHGPSTAGDGSDVYPDEDSNHGQSEESDS
jgi:hypothetical protein